MLIVLLLSLDSPPLPSEEFCLGELLALRVS